jgi:acyl-CoA thioester hydrolase
MHNNGSEAIAATTVISGVHLDTQLRRVCPFPKEIIERAQQLIVEITPVV